MIAGKWLGPTFVTFFLVAPVAANPPCCDDGDACAHCVSRACSDRTLFRWSGDLGASGPGPDAPLASDRPDFTEASSTVGLGVAQVEFGYTFIQDDDGLTETEFHSWGEALLRVGVIRDWLELRIAAFPVTETLRTVGVNQTESGLEDLYLGLKLALTPQAGFRPEMAIVPQMFVPLGSSAFTADEVLPGVNWLYGWDLSEDYSFAGSTQFNRRLSPTGEAYTVWAQSLTAGFSLTDRWGAYTEWFALFPHSADDDVKPVHYFDGGFTYLITDDLQWDIRAGVGANDAADDFFCGSGFAWRFR